MGSGESHPELCSNSFTEMIVKFRNRLLREVVEPPALEKPVDVSLVGMV